MAIFPRLYDMLLEPLIGGFREAGVRLVDPEPGLRVVDVGCGTGTHLALYQRAGCDVAGVDTNPDMIQRARERLGSEADVREADATSLPFPDDSFGLATTMLVLHEMEPDDRIAVVQEMARVAHRVLVIDHHPSPERSLRGSAIRFAATAIERIAGGDHFRNYRRFIASGGLPAVATAAGRRIIASTTEAAGTMGVYLLR